MLVAVHRIYVEQEVRPGELAVVGEEAHHAVRVRRLGTGARVEVLDGRGSVGAGVIAGMAKGRGGWELRLEVESVSAVLPVVPRVEVFCPRPKGARLSEMIDGLSQVGAAKWSPLETALSVSAPSVKGGRAERVERIAREASKQCGRAWLMEVGEGVSFADLLTMRAPVGEIVLADVSGNPYEPTGSEMVRLLVGPEGGWREDELARARAAGVHIARFGPHVMRIETAAVVGAAVVIHSLRVG
jgi:16S rRNA (uracil1498-N3)-methyltransferase